MVGISLGIRIGGGQNSGPSPLTIYNNWVNDGIWNDAVPTSGQTWATPTGKGNAFAVWDDNVVTT